MSSDFFRFLQSIGITSASTEHARSLTNELLSMAFIDLANYQDVEPDTQAICYFCPNCHYVELHTDDIEELKESCESDNLPYVVGTPLEVIAQLAQYTQERIERSGVQFTVGVPQNDKGDK